MSKFKKRGKALKIQEFYAHSETVNTVCLGKQSSHVLATGGDDYRVNIWKLGKHQPLMSLVGHQTEVDSVMFDAPEEIVAAGSRGGSIKLWDLAHEKLVRTLIGHRSSIKCLDFHPYGDFFASGSADTNLKVWDIRKKGCMQTYKGHNSVIHTVKHSPDGRWVVSGDADGLVKVWDLTAGKLVRDLEVAPAGSKISCLDFHPHEFLLSVGSSARQLSLWDMESFEVVCNTGKETHPIKSCVFSRDGSALLGATQDGLKSWGWEPVRNFDTVDVAWQNLSDVSISEADELIGVSHAKTVVSIYLVDLPQMAPFNGGPSAAGDDVDDVVAGVDELRVKEAPVALSTPRKTSVAVPSRNPTITPNPRNSSPRDSPTKRLIPTSTHVHTASRLSKVEPEARSDRDRDHDRLHARGPSPRASDTATQAAQRHDSSRYASIISKHKQQYKDQQARGTARNIVEAPKPKKSVDPPVNYVVGGGEVRRRPSSANPSRPSSAAHASSQSRAGGSARPSSGHAKVAPKPLSPKKKPPSPKKPLVASSPRAAGPQSPSAPISSHSGRHASMGTSMPALPDDEEATAPARRQAGLEGFHPPPARYPGKDMGSGPPVVVADSRSEGREGLGQTLILEPHTKDGPLGLNVNSFLPSTAPPEGPNEMDQAAIRSKIMQENSLMCQILSQRLQNLRVLKMFWHKGNIKGAVQALVKMNDLPVAVDFLNGIESALVTGNLLTLETVMIMLPMLKNLLGSRFENYVTTSLRYLRLQLRSFSQLITDTRAAPKGFINPSREDRLTRCNECHEIFKTLHPIVGAITKKSKEIGHLARDVRDLLEKLLES